MDSPASIPVANSESKDARCTQAKLSSAISMDFIASLSNDSLDTGHFTSLTNAVQQECSRLEHDGVEVVKQAQSLSYDAHDIVQKPYTGLDLTTLVQSTIRILSQEMSGSTYDYKIMCDETSELCTVRVKQRLASLYDIHRPWEMEARNLFKSSFTSDMQHVSEIQTMKGLYPPPAHRRPIYSTANVNLAVYDNSISKPPQNQDNFSIEHEPLDLTTKSKQQVKALISVDAHKDKIVSRSDEGWKLSSNYSGNVEAGDIGKHKNNSGGELQNNPSTFNETVHSCTNLVYGDQATETSAHMFCVCFKATEYNREIPCGCLRSESMLSVSSENSIGANVNPAENVDTASVLGYCQSRNGHVSEYKDDCSKDSSKVVTTLSQKLNLPVPPIESSHISDAGSNISEHLPVALYKADDIVFLDEIHTEKSLTSPANSREQPSLLCDSALPQQLSRSYLQTHVRMDAVSSNNSHCAINNYVHGVSTSRTVECGLRNTEYLQDNRSKTILENMSVNSVDKTGISCTEKCQNTPIVTSYDCTVSLIPEQDSLCYNADISETQFSASDLEMSPCSNPKLYKTNNVSFEAWSIKNDTESTLATSLKIRLRRDSAAVPESSLQATYSVYEEPSSGDGVHVGSREVEGCSDSETSTTVKQQQVFEREEVGYSFLSYPSTPEISHVNQTSLNHLTNSSIYKTASSTPFVIHTDTDNQKASTLNRLDIRPGQTRSQNKRYKCLDAVSALNTGFLVGKDKTRKTYFNDADNKEVQSSTYIFTPASATDKIALSRMTKSKKTGFLGSLKRKLLCGKSDTSFLQSQQDISRKEKSLGHLSASTKQEQSTANQGLSQTQSCIKSVTVESNTRDSSRSCNNQFNRNTSSQNRYSQATKIATSAEHSSLVLTRISDSHNKNTLQNVGTLTTSSQQSTEKLVNLPSQELLHKPYVLSDLSSSIRKCKTANSTRKGTEPTPLKNIETSRSKMKVRFVTMPQDPHHFWDSTKDKTGNNTSQTSTRSCMSNISKMRQKSDQVLELSKANTTFLVDERGTHLTMDNKESPMNNTESFLVSQLSTDSADLLATFMYDRTARKLQIRLRDEVSKEILFCMCLRCSIKTTPSDYDNLIATLEKSKKSRFPTERDIRQVTRATQRQC